MGSMGANSGSSVSAFTTSSTIPFWLKGKQVMSAETFDVISPLDQKPLYKCSSASEGDVLRAVKAAKEAYMSWSQTKPDTRRDIFLRAAELFERRRKEMFHYSHTETGAAQNIFDIEHGFAANACRSIAGLIQVATTSSMPIVAEEGRHAMLVKEPYGVVLAISPWNIPNVLGLRACLQPLAMGNTVVLKGPEAAPGTLWAIASILHEAGLPAGCLNTLYHRPADAAKITNMLIAHPAIKKINFTGSTPVGAIIAQQAGKHLKPTVMELGGKNPVIVCEDADIQQAALKCAMGAFLHSGQICMSTERIIVNAKIADTFRSALCAAVLKFFADQGTVVAQLVNTTAVEKNQWLLKDALTKGANLANNIAHSIGYDGTRMQPVVIEHVKPGMEIYNTESFGPTVSLFVVDTDEEAVAIANDTPYGLSSAVFTEDLRRGFNVARAIESGAVHINSMTVHDEPALPHGGMKNSGWGRFSGLQGLDEWVQTKVVSWRD
ncbi:vanillin dehydrogenase [Trichoderma camerunense]